MGDWADLPLDILSLIAKRIDLYEDLVAFGGVCRSWRSVAVKENFNPSTLVPWLMLPEEKSGDVRGFVSVTKGGMVRKVELPEARGRLCVSSKGWFITMDSATYDMELLHPLTRVRIPLPHPRTYKYYKEGGMTVRKAALSAIPSVTEEDYALMVIFGGFYIGFWKPGNNIWTVIETQQDSCCIDDVIYYKDEIYAVNDRGHLLLCNLDSGMSQIVGYYPSGNLGANSQAYLVDNGSELLIVSTRRATCTVTGFGDKYHEFTLYLRVFKFDPTNTKQYYWLEVIGGDEFGGRSIFVSPKADTVVVASPAAVGIEPNCIYFADWFVNRYVAINPSSDKNTRRADCRIRLEYGSSLHSNYPVPPIWILPSF